MSSSGLFHSTLALGFFISWCQLQIVSAQLVQPPTATCWLDINCSFITTHPNGPRCCGEFPFVRNGCCSRCCDNGDCSGSGEICQYGQCYSSPGAVVVPDPIPVCYKPLVGCYSSETWVHVEHVGRVPMDQVKIGDKVLVGSDGIFSEVYAFAHRDVTATATFVQLHFADTTTTTTTTDPVELTADHLIFRSNGQADVAANLRVGDELLFVVTAPQQNNNNKMTSTTTARRIAQVNNVVRSSGVYAPMSRDGRIVVNGGIVGSSYVSPQTDQSGKPVNHVQLGKTFQTNLSWHTIMHIAMAPERVACRFVSCEQAGGSATTANHSKWVQFLLHFQWFVDTEHDVLVQYGLLPILLCFFVGVGCLFLLLENVMPLVLATALVRELLRLDFASNVVTVADGKTKTYRKQSVCR